MVGLQPFSSISDIYQMKICSVSHKSIEEDN